ncbi:MAG: ATP-binding protein [Sciscionella sp.]
MPEPPNSSPSMVTTVADVGDLAWLRCRITSSARASSTLSRAAVEEFLVAVNEMVCNGLAHGAPPVHVTQWAEVTALTCQVVDSGPGRLPPLTGYRHPGTRGTLGLWAARQLVDDLFIGDAPNGGTSVLLTMTTQET